jgi:hypothetical protein
MFHKVEKVGKIFVLKKKKTIIKLSFKGFFKCLESTSSGQASRISDLFPDF